MLLHDGMWIIMNNPMDWNGVVLLNDLTYLGLAVLVLLLPTTMTYVRRHACYTRYQIFHSIICQMFDKYSSPSSSYNSRCRQDIIAS